MASTSTSSIPTRVIDLPPNHEFSFELEPYEQLSITLLTGLAEVFGRELVPHQPHPFGDEVRACVWTPTGCRLEVRGAVENSYVGDEGSTRVYQSLHLGLSRMREEARPSSTLTSTTGKATVDWRQVQDDEVLPPRVLVVGERGAGKSSLIKSLLNWRVREAWALQGGQGATIKGGGGALYVNLDTKEGGLTMPGTLSITPINSLLPTTTPSNAFGTSGTSGPAVPFPQNSGSGSGSGSGSWTAPASIDAYAPTVNPLVYWFGHQDPSDAQPLYDHLLKRMGKSLRDKFAQGGLMGWKAGCLIDTPGEWAEKKGLGMIGKAVRALEVNVVLVVGNQRLEDQVKKLLDTNKTVTVVRVPAANGASEPDEALQRRIKDAQIRSYFYGGPALTTGVLSPFSIIVKFDDLRIVQIGEALSAQAPDSALPIGFGRTVGDLDLVLLDLEASSAPSSLLFRLLGIPQALEGSEDGDVVGKAVLGWVYVSAIDQVKKKATLLSPLPGRLPRKTLVLGSIDWQDA
ncbi:BQ2448_5545 [Microbotryum intermedium]|uniref:Polynucleotide 5'-hydroxyl-kinase GRC3 n=1 Tax=Microbotryum intermedium TaxID=269621 RepID=A0A238F2G2_9BASI|nr:BQ2448_5545 [Microbotryum intermedium]